MSARFPNSVSTDADLLLAKNRAQTTLVGDLNSSDTTFTLASDAFGANVAITIDSEIILIVAKSGVTVTSAVRGFDGTARSPHPSGKLVSAYIDAYHHNQVSAEVQAIETALGVNLSNVAPRVLNYTSLFDFAAQQPGGSLAIGSNTLVLSPCPLGINASSINHCYLRISLGVGAAESCLITGFIAGAGSAQVTITCANTHSGSWQVASASGGIQEAIIDGLTNQRDVYIVGAPSAGFTPCHATIYIPPAQNFRIDSGNAVLTFDPNPADGFLIDSAEDADYRLPLLVYPGTGSAVNLKPTLPTPNDGIISFTDSRLEIVDIGNNGPAFAGHAVAGLLLTATNDISRNRILVGGAGGFQYGVKVTAGQCVGNSIVVQDMHDCTVAQVQDDATSASNEWDVVVAIGAQGPSAYGAIINGISGIWLLRSSAAGLGKGLLLNSTASQNVIISPKLDGGYTSTSTAINRLIITDSGSYAANKLGFSVTTPAFPASGVVVPNNNLTPVIVTFLTAGTTASTVVYDGLGATAAGPSVAAGVQVYLNPGDGIACNFAVAPSWKWRAVA